jgi:hypothetical protein
VGAKRARWRVIAAAALFAGACAAKSGPAGEDDSAGAGGALARGGRTGAGGGPRAGGAGGQGDAGGGSAGEGGARSPAGGAPGSGGAGTVDAAPTTLDAPAAGNPDASLDAPAPRPVADNEVAFDPPGGGFAGTVMLRLSARAPGATIHFTVDGSAPTKASPVYRAPVAIRETAIVRAFVAGAGKPDGPVAAAVYLRLGADVEGFSSNLPVVVLHTHSTTPLPILGNTMVSGSGSVFEPRAGGRTVLQGPAAVSARAGVRIRGNSSRAFPQKSYAMELREGGSDEDQGQIVAGMPSEADWALVAPSWVDRSLIRTALAFALSNEIGRYAPRVRMVEAFVVETGGPVTMRSHLGVFALCEKIERDKDRVNVEKLEPTDTTPPLVGGGYVFRVDHEARDFTAGGLNFGWVYPEPVELALPAREPQRTYMQRYMQELAEALDSPTFKHPRTGKPYADYIDVGAFIDLHLLNVLLKNVDAFRFSSYFHKTREGRVAAGPLWDVDRSSGTPFDDQARALDPREWARADATHPLTWGWFARLFADPAWKSAHAKRWAELAAGSFAPAHIHALIDQLAAGVGEAQRRHFARWPEAAPTGGAHGNEIKILKDWFTARVAWVSTQL